MAKKNDTPGYDVEIFDELMAEAEALPKGSRAKVAALSAAFNLAAFGSQAGLR